MIALNITIERTQLLHVWCHPENEKDIRKAHENTRAIIHVTEQCPRGEWISRLMEADR